MNKFTAVFERGEKCVIATCAEVPEAHGQGPTHEAALQDLAGSIQSILEYRRDEALARAGQSAETAVVEVP